VALHKGPQQKLREGREAETRLLLRNKAGLGSCSPAEGRPVLFQVLTPSSRAKLPQRRAGSGTPQPVCKYLLQ